MSTASIEDDEPEDSAMFKRRWGIVLAFCLTMGLIWGTYSVFAGWSLNGELLRAAQRGDENGVKAAVARGANINAHDLKGFTILEWAAYEGDVKTVSALLASSDAMSPETLARGMTMAAWRGRPAIVKLFLAREVSPDLRKDPGETALMSACRAEAPDRFGALTSAQLLIRAGANVNVRNHDGSTALDIAKQNGFADVARLLRKAGAE